MVSLIGHIGKIKLTAPKSTLVPLRDLGIAWFLLQKGAAAGPKFVSTLQQYGVMLLLIGALISCVSLLFAYAVARFVFRIPLFGALGATTGAMTAAPSLNALIGVSKDDRVASLLRSLPADCNRRTGGSSELPRSGARRLSSGRI